MNTNSKELTAPQVDAAASRVGRVMDDAPTAPRRGILSGFAGMPIQAGRIAIAVAFFVLWEIAVRRKWIDPFFLPAPTDVWTYLVESVKSGELWHNSSSTLVAFVAAFITGSASGILAGFLLARFRTLDALTWPFVLALNSLPRVALAPLFIIYFGIGQTSKIAVGFSLVFFILLINTRAGLRTVEDDLIILARIYGNPPMQVFRKVMLPFAIPVIFGGLRLAAVYALLGVVVGELMASQAGLGVMIRTNSNLYNLPGVFAGLFMLVFFSMTLTSIMGLFERRLLRWQSND